ncbi:MAG TPA: nucleotide exchange factor GrpE [Kofleriaceae bacterium]|jgi:molecular chaperone GrpE
MSGEPSSDEKPDADAGESGVIPVEVEPPDAPAEAAADPVAVLEHKLAAVEKDKKDNWDRYLRAAADLENLRKRGKREVDEARLDTKNKVLKEMLPVVDNLERAVEHAGTDPATKPIVEGVQLVLRQFQTAFERLDITAVDALGQAFDPNLHEAISQIDSDQPPGTVIQVLQRGYRAGDRLLRPALVVVAKAKAAAE